MSNAPVSVWATARLEGFHHWPGASGKREYLAARHRHLFHIRVEVPVDHTDRAVEFHDLGDQIRNIWSGGGLWEQPRELGAMSCEDIAIEMRGALVSRGIPVSLIEVSEDGENGAVVRWDEDEWGVDDDE